MNKYFLTIAFVVLASCKAQQFVVIENGRVYPCDEIGTIVYDSTTFKPNILKITIIGKKGEYTYEVTDKSGNISTNGNHEKTHCVKKLMLKKSE